MGGSDVNLIDEIVGAGGAMADVGGFPSSGEQAMHFLPFGQDPPPAQQ